MTEPRALYVVHHHEFSGAELMHVPLLEADEDALLACPPGSATEDLARRLGAATAPLPYRTLRWSGGALETARSVPRGMLGARDLRSVFRANPDRQLIFCTSVRPALLASLAAVGLDRRLLWCVPDFLPPQPLRSAIRAVARHSVGRVLCLSEAIKRDFAGSSRRLNSLSSVVYPGVEPAPVRSSPPSPPTRVAIVGHVSPTKRTDLAIEIVRRVADEIPGVRLEVIGKAQFRDEDFAFERELKRRVRERSELRSVVEFRGYVEDVRGALRECGALLHCRDDEPFGIALLEGMAAGLPIVAPASAGPLEIVEDGVTGCLYRPGDAADGARRLAGLLSDPALATRMGDAGRELLARRFSVSRQLEETRRLMSEALAL